MFANMDLTFISDGHLRLENTDPAFAQDLASIAPICAAVRMFCACGIPLGNLKEKDTFQTGQAKGTLYTSQRARCYCPLNLWKCSDLQAEYGSHLFVEPRDVSLSELFSSEIKEALSTRVRNGAVPLVRCLDRITREERVVLLRLILQSLTFPPHQTSECLANEADGYVEDTELPETFSGQVLRYAKEPGGPQVPRRRNHSFITPSSVVDFLSDAPEHEYKALIDGYFPKAEGGGRSLVSDAWMHFDEQKGKLASFLGLSYCPTLICQQWKLFS